jgi:hypothetical protein
MVTLLTLVAVLVVVGLAVFALSQEHDCPKVVRIMAELYWVNILLTLACIRLVWGIGKVAFKTSRWFWRVLRYFLFLIRKRSAKPTTQTTTPATAK